MTAAFMTALFPKTVTEAVDALGADVEVRAGGTDYQERVSMGLVRGAIVDLRDVAELTTIEIEEQRARIGARVSLAALASSEALAERHPALTLATGALATPEIRRAATLGGNLLQRNRCPYYRQPGSTCFKAGGSGCPAREGDAHHGALVDLGPCIAPHPSTVGLALVLYDARVEVSDGSTMSLAELYGDGTDPRVDHHVPPRTMLTAVTIEAPEWGAERGGYARTISRRRAEWPMVDACARLVLERGIVTHARVSIGGVANVPLRMPALESALVGSAPDDATLEAAAERGRAELCARGSQLPGAAYKVTMVVPTVVDALRDARDGGRAR